MDADCYCDFEAPTVFNRTEPKAHKQHRCDECGRTIQIGEQYERAEGLWEGRWSTFKTCADCVGFREYVAAHIPCFCWEYGNVIDGGKEELGEVWHECPGLVFGALRYLVSGNRKRKANGKRETSRSTQHAT